MSIIQKIWQLAERQRVKKVELANVMGISRQTLDNWLDGKGGPNAEQMARVAQRLGVSLSEMMGEVKEVVQDQEWKDKYIALLEQYNECLKRMAEMEPKKNKAVAPATP